MKGGYNTAPTSAILAFFKQNPDKRFTARDVGNSVNSPVEQANRSSVYRIIDKLSNEGFLLKYTDVNDKTTSYLYSEGHGPCNKHAHAKCSECDKVFHLKNEILEEAAKKIIDEYGFDIHYKDLMITGICKECKEKMNKTRHP